MKPKLISVKLKPETFELLMRYTREKKMKNISTTIRSLVVRKLRKEGLVVPLSWIKA